MERLMHYLWQHRLYESDQMATVDGRPVSVVDPGQLNTDAGPDFFNAKVVIDGHTWAGNVEMHLRASDWHRHDSDPAYDSVVLHVVEADDARVRRRDGSEIPQLVLHRSPHFDAALARLNDPASSMPCAARLGEVPPLLLTDWTDALAIERLQAKANRLYELLRLLAGDWEEVCYVALARALGFGINGDAMERLARRTPLRLLRKHSDSPLQLEALLLGQAGLLPPAGNDDDHTARLRGEYAFLANKFSLRPMEREAWRLFRIRPQNFPYRRVALLARHAEGGFGLLRRLLDTTTADGLRRLLDAPLGDYWTCRFTFGPPTATRAASLSRAMADTLLINTVAPLLYAYGEATGASADCDRAIGLLQQLPPERIAAVRRLAAAGLPCRDAFESQALLQLRKAYCETRKCIYCRIGHRLLSNAAKQYDAHNHSNHNNPILNTPQ